MFAKVVIREDIRKEALFGGLAYFVFTGQYRNVVRIGL